MVPVRARTANARFKATSGSRVWACVCLSVALHFAFFAFFPPIGVAELNGESSRDDDRDIYVLLELPFVPPPPEPIDHPPLPPVGDVPQPEQPEITPPGLEPPNEIRPPDTEADRPQSPTVYLIVDIPPRLLDPEQAEREARRRYPRLLRRAGIGGTVEVFATLDTLGSVIEVSLARTSGHDALDEAALDAVREFRYSPAISRDKRVRAQIRVSIEFRAR